MNWSLKSCFQQVYYNGSVYIGLTPHDVIVSIYSGLYLSNFIKGVEVLAIEVDDRANA